MRAIMRHQRYRSETCNGISVRRLDEAIACRLRSFAAQEKHGRIGQGEKKKKGKARNLSIACQRKQLFYITTGVEWLERNLVELGDERFSCKADSYVWLLPVGFLFPFCLQPPWLKERRPQRTGQLTKGAGETALNRKRKKRVAKAVAPLCPLTRRWSTRCCYWKETRDCFFFHFDSEDFATV